MKSNLIKFTILLNIVLVISETLPYDLYRYRRHTIDNKHSMRSTVSDYTKRLEDLSSHSEEHIISNTTEDPENRNEPTATNNITLHPEHNRETTATGNPDDNDYVTLATEDPNNNNKSATTEHTIDTTTPKNGKCQNNNHFFVLRVPLPINLIFILAILFLKTINQICVSS